MPSTEKLQDQFTERINKIKKLLPKKEPDESQKTINLDGVGKVLLSYLMQDDEPIRMGYGVHTLIISQKGVLFSVPWRANKHYTGFWRKLKAQRAS